VLDDDSAALEHSARFEARLSEDTNSARLEASDFSPQGEVCRGTEAQNDRWSAVLSEVASAPSVDPLPFMKVASRTQGLVGQRLGHFRILERLGEGGMGVVYKAEDEKLGRLVALKVVRPRYLVDQAQHQRLLREARSAAAVNHPNIAAIYEVGEADGVAFIAMEYVDGKPLRSLIESRPPSESEALQYALDIARGLARAHSAGIIHRDLKPDNLLVDGDGRVKILDFGLAKPLQQLELGDPPPDSARPWQLLNKNESHVQGTPPYMSPEQTDGKVVDARSDIYSFGVLLHELITGSLPMTSEQRWTARRSQSSNGTKLQSIVERCLATTKNERFANGAELLTALDEVGRRQPVFATKHGLRGVGALLAIAVAAALVAIAVVVRTSPGRASSDRAKSTEPRPWEHRLTANPIENMIKDAAISPDGSMLAYVDQVGLFLRRIDPPRTDRLPVPEELLISGVGWFPDSRSLFVSAWTTGLSGHSVWRIHLDGSAERLLEKSVPEVPRVSPDGKKFAWVDGQRIRWTALHESRIHDLSPPPNEDEILPESITWSPSNKRLAYVRVREAATAFRPLIETADLDGDPPRVVIDDLHLVQENCEPTLGWAPDGRLVYGLADWPPREPGTTLWALAVNPDSGEVDGIPVKVVDPTTSVEGRISISSRGGLAFQRYVGQLDVYVAELLDQSRRLGKLRKMSTTELDERPSGWSPDGRTIVFMSNQNGTQDVFLQELTSATPRIITDAPAWSTWARYAGPGLLLFWQLPFSENDKPVQARLMRLALPNGIAEPVLSAGEPVAVRNVGRPPPKNVQFRCPSQSGICFLGELERNQLRISTLDPKSGLSHELLRLNVERAPRAVEWDISPDGSKIALPRTDSRLRIVDLATQSIRDIEIPGGCYLQSVSWTADGNGTFATGQCSGTDVLRLMFVDQAGATHVLYESRNEWIGNPVASPDGKHIAFALKPQKLDVWLLDRF